MNQPSLSALRDLWRESDSDEDRATYLQAWALTDAPPIPDALEVAARFGSEAAAQALGREPLSPAEVLRMQTSEELRAAFGSWEAGFVYLLSVSRFVRGFWLQRGEAEEGAMAELEPLLKSSQAWFDRRSDQDAETALVWSRASWAQAELLAGRLGENHGRGIQRLVLSLGGLAYVCAALDEPPRRDLPKVSTKGVSEDEVRFQRVVRSHFETREAVKSVLYAEAPELNTKIGAFRKDLDPIMARYEARAGGALARWILTSALNPRM